MVSRFLPRIKLEFTPESKLEHVLIRKREQEGRPMGIGYIVTEHKQGITLIVRKSLDSEILSFFRRVAQREGIA